MGKCIPSTLLALVVATGLTGCASMKNLNWPPEVKDTNALMSYFDDRSVGFLYEGPSVAPRFSVPAQQFTVGNGHTMQVFEYTNSGAVLLDVTALDDFMNGHNAPHLYRGENMIVVYYGNDIGVMNALSDVLGSPVG